MCGVDFILYMLFWLDLAKVNSSKVHKMQVVYCICTCWCVNEPAVNWPRQGTDLFGTEMLQIREWQGYYYCYPRAVSSQFNSDRASVPLCMEQMVMRQTARLRIYRKRNRMSHTSDSLSCKLHSRSHMNHMKLHREK